MCHEIVEVSITLKNKTAGLSNIDIFQYKQYRLINIRYFSFLSQILGLKTWLNNHCTGKVFTAFIAV